MASLQKYYWDACIWIELITQRDQDRVSRCMNVLDMVEKNKAELWTSAFTLAEVWKKKCGTTSVGIEKEDDRTFEDFIEQESIKKISVDVDVGILARRLLRKHPEIGKPQDAVHVASCLLNNIDELHTFDGRDLLHLDGDLPRIDKIKLKICEPPAPTVEAQQEMMLDDQKDDKNPT